MNYFLISPSRDAYFNLALDEYLLNTLSEDDTILYLYVNEKAVIIGRNQNPWIECNLNQLNADGVQLVRRISGGGAVYHDEGNLNFSFICGKKHYSEKQQTEMITDCLHEYGITAEVTGRNDIAVDGRKISGNAYCQRGNMQQRHGTLLVSSELTVFDRYLVVPKTKLVAKGVKSVRSRVMNLSEANDTLTVSTLSQTLIEAFKRRYECALPFEITDSVKAETESIRKRISGWEWKMGEAPAFDFTAENRFPFGTCHICFQVVGGEISGMKIFTDSLDITLPERICPLFEKLRFDKNEIQKKFLSAEGEAKAIAEYLIGTME